MSSRHNYKHNRRQWRQQESEELEESLMENVQECEKSKNSFAAIYSRWLPERQNTLRELEDLKSKVHEDQLNFNSAHYVFKEVGYHSRSLKTCSNSESADFWGSLGAFLSEAANGVTSLAQAINIEKYQKQFQEIMDKDTEITKRLHTAKNRCVHKFRGIEEMVRKYDAVTFESTLDKICATLKIENSFKSIKGSYGNDSMSAMMSGVGNVIDNNLSIDKFKEIGESLDTYFDSNPAAMDACKSTGRAIYTAVDNWGVDKKKNSIVKHVTHATNRLMMMEDRREADRLRLQLDKNKSQAKLESQIEETIHALRSEMKNIIYIYNSVF